MKSTGKSAKTTPLARGAPIDVSQYGPAATGSFAQPFWGQALDANGKFLYDENGNALGIDGKLYGDDPWDRVRLNGTFLPGVWEATATPAIQLDVQKPSGFDGAALVSRGYVPAGITITGRIWTPEQWIEFQRILPTFWAVPNHYAVNDVKRQVGQIQGKQRSVDVYHPGLAAMNVKSLVIRQITPPEPTGEKGVRQIRIIAVEYVPEPQKKPPANKKIEGTGKDRTVQAQKILGKGFGMQLRPPNLPPIHNAPLPPSIGEANKR